VGFVDQSGAPTVVTDPTITITNSRTGAVVVTAEDMSGTGLPVGSYEYSLFLTDYEEGLYYIRAAAVLGTIPVAIEGSFEVRAPTPDESLIYAVKSRLKDLEPILYELDLPVPKWNPSEIHRELMNALMALNFTGKMATSFNMGDCPRHDLLIDYAFGKVLQSAAILENWNTLRLTDGSANLTIDRVQMLTTMATDTLNRVRQDMESWKKSQRPRIIGQGSSYFPTYIRRAIGFLPNMTQIFG